MTETMKIWKCKIGEVERSQLPQGSDWPMRQAIVKAYEDLTGLEPDFIFSGWGAELDAGERACVEDRHPTNEEWKQTDEYRRQLLAHIESQIMYRDDSMPDAVRQLLEEAENEVWVTCACEPKKPRWWGNADQWEMRRYEDRAKERTKRCNWHKRFDELERALAQQEERVPEGWKLVPVEPTYSQIDNGEEYRLAGLSTDAMYRVMIAAAPEPDSGEGDD